MKITVVVSSGQYETAAENITVNATTARGLSRRAKQLSLDHAVYGDNWAGWINATVTLASDNDDWGDNQIIGGQWCNQEGLDLIDATYKQISAATGLIA